MLTTRGSTKRQHPTCPSNSIVCEFQKLLTQSTAGGCACATSRIVDKTLLSLSCRSVMHYNIRGTALIDIRCIIRCIRCNIRCINFSPSYMFFFSISMTAISMMRLRFCQNEFAKSPYLPKYKSYEETNCTVIKGFQN